MADQRMEVEKVEEMYRKQLEIQEHFLTKREGEHQVALEREREHYVRQLKIVEENMQERIKDLTAQNDGMLAAIGRLHGECERTKDTLQVSELKRKEVQQQFSSMEQMFQLKLQETEDSARGMLERAKQDQEKAKIILMGEIEKLKKENVALKKGKKR